MLPFSPVDFRGVDQVHTSLNQFLKRLLLYQLFLLPLPRPSPVTGSSLCSRNRSPCQSLPMLRCRILSLRPRGYQHLPHVSSPLREEGTRAAGGGNSVTPIRNERGDVLYTCYLVELSAHSLPRSSSATQACLLPRCICLISLVEEARWHVGARACLMAV